jgi:hypothetical protein
MRQKILDPFKDRKFEPFSFTETLKFATGYSAQQNFVYDPEQNHFTNLTASLTLLYFTTSFTAVRSKPYELVSNLGWVQSTGDESFTPRDLRLSYAQTVKKEGLFDNRFSFAVNINTGLTFDLQRYTYSKFDFSLGVTLKVTKFVDFSFTTTSENAVITRYFQDLPFINLQDELPGEKNLFKDLINSFRFDNDVLRRSSGFKLKTFRLALTHYLGDWNAQLGITLSPYLDQNSMPYRYKFNNEISFLVQWLPIPEIKTDILYNKEEFTVR